ncbi:hypothetical protein LCGC14_3108960, partial [marine sediment metagenome]
MNDFNFSVLKGLVITKITGGVGDDDMIFNIKGGKKYRLYYQGDCCATCSIEDIAGELDDLLNSPILLAEEVFNCEKNPEGVTLKYQDSFTWTFYKLSTIKGSVT